MSTNQTNLQLGVCLVDIGRDVVRRGERGEQIADEKRAALVPVERVEFVREETAQQHVVVHLRRRHRPRENARCSDRTGDGAGRPISRHRFVHPMRMASHLVVIEVVPEVAKPDHATPQKANLRSALVQLVFCLFVMIEDRLLLVLRASSYVPHGTSVGLFDF